MIRHIVNDIEIQLLVTWIDLGKSDIKHAWNIDKLDIGSKDIEYIIICIIFAIKLNSSQLTAFLVETLYLGFDFVAQNRILRQIFFLLLAVSCHSFIDF